MEIPSHHKILYSGIAGTLLLIGCGIFYYLVIFLPHQAELKAQQEQALLHQQQQAAEQEQQLQKVKLDQQQAKLDQENMQKSAQATALQDCLDRAFTTYEADWTAACADFGQNNKFANCTLPMYNANAVNGYYKDAKDLCLKQYPQQ